MNAPQTLEDTINSFSHFFVKEPSLIEGVKSIPYPPSEIHFLSGVQESEDFFKLLRNKADWERAGAVCRLVCGNYWIIIYSDVLVIDDNKWDHQNALCINYEFLSDLQSALSKPNFNLLLNFI